MFILSYTSIRYTRVDIYYCKSIFFKKKKYLFDIFFLGANMVSTVAGDGKLVSWDLRNVEKMMKGLKL